MSEYLDKIDAMKIALSVKRPDKTVIGNVRVLKSAAGYYIGRLCYEDGCAQPYERISDTYWPNAEMAQEVLDKNRDDYI